MSSKFQQNAIISGYLHCYCLVCDVFFETEGGILSHLEEEGHEMQLLAFPYLEKYGDNNIRKVNKGYFCEFCTLLLATAAKVSLHIADRTHTNNQSLSLLRRINGVVTAFNNIVISESAWHGLDSETCAICNVEYSNEGIHKAEPGHLLSLVQNKVEFVGNNVYRKTDDSSFQCLTCNSVFALNSINQHFQDADHKTLYTKCQEEMNKLALKTDTQKEKPKKVDNNHNKIEEAKKKNEKDNNQNIKKNECKELVLKDTKNEDETTKYAKENNLTYNIGQPNTFCRLCEIKVPSSLRCMKEHVNGKEHKNRLAKTKVNSEVVIKKPNITRKPFKKFVQHMLSVENVMFHDTVINEKYCISNLSFMMMTTVGSRLRCQSCEVNIYSDDIEEHYESEKHVRAVDMTPVITSLPDTEFVRELRTNIYHCGYCNLVSGGWESLTNHLASGAHREAREACNWRLQRHLPDVRQHRRGHDEFVEFMIMQHMLGNRLGHN